MQKTIKVKVSAGAKTEKIEEVEYGVFKVRVSEPPEKGKANARVLELVSKYFRVSKTKVFLVSGNTYREKIIKIDF